MSRTPEPRPPVLHRRMSPADKALEIAAAGGVLLIVLILIRYWRLLPDLIPHNFDALGNVNRWGNKQILPVISSAIIAIYGILTVITSMYRRIPSRETPAASASFQNHSAGETFLRWVKTEIVWMYMFIQWKTVQVALGHAAGLGLAFLPASLAIVNVTIVVGLCRAYGSK